MAVPEAKQSRSVLAVVTARVASEPGVVRLTQEQGRRLREKGVDSIGGRSLVTDFRGGVDGYYVVGAGNRTAL